MTFLAETLKPYIDSHYNTLTDSAATFVCGSSMGGLISLYALLKYPHIFGAAAIFSPSFWITGTQLDEDIKKTGLALSSRIYLYGGNLEGESMISDLQHVAQVLKTQTAAQIQVSIDARGRHNESSWKREFPAAYDFLLHP